MKISKLHFKIKETKKDINFEKKEVFTNKSSFSQKKGRCSQKKKMIFTNKSSFSQEKKTLFTKKEVTLIEK